jgi:uncharacterized protein
MKTWIAAAACAAALGLARPAWAQEPTAAHLAAARDLIAAASDSANFYTAFEMGVRRSMPATADSTVVLEAVHGWATRFLRWKELEPQYARLYASFYTEAELHDIAAFMRSPAGRKMSSVAPQIALGAMEIGRNAASEHMVELQQAVTEAVQNTTRKPR